MFRQILKSVIQTFRFPPAYDRHSEMPTRSRGSVLVTGQLPPPQQQLGAHRPHCFRSTLSLAFPAAVVCHCMLVGSSGPPHASGMM